MLSIFYCDKFIYHYPNTKEQLSEDLKNKFPQDRFDKFRVNDNLDVNDTFILKFNGRLSAEISASVKPYAKGLEMEMEIDANPIMPIIIVLGITIFVRLFGSNESNSGFALVIPIFLSPILLIQAVVEFTYKKRLKKYFEENLGLPTNDEIVERRFKIL
jgi:hypothetical protein